MSRERIRSARTGVVLLNHGVPDDTWACLDALETSTDLDLDPVVVDNAPEGPEHARLRAGVGRRAEVIASGGNLGYAAGNNIGIARLLERGVEHVWLINPDCHVEPTTLRRLHRVLDSRPRCGVVGARLVLPGEPARIWYDGGRVSRRTGATSHRHHGSLESETPAAGAQVTGYVTGACFLVRAQALEEVGLLPERYFMYYEETDWCLRARAAGWRSVVQPRARAVHLKRSGAGVPAPYAVYYLTRNRFFFARDCLGIDPDAALEHCEATLVAGWRRRVAQEAPGWLPNFEDLVAQARTDAWAGRDGRREDVERVAAADLADA